MSSHTFWDKQPVSNNTKKFGIINKKCLKRTNNKQIELPDGLKWKTLNINSEKDLKVITSFLNKYYNFNDNLVSLKYTTKLVKWCLDYDITDFNLKSIKTTSDWNIGIVQENKIIGFISAVPIYLSIKGNNYLTAEINFLCVHTKLRKLGVAPLLINELIRLVRTTNPKLLVAPIFTSKNLPFNKIFEARYLFRFLNIDKLRRINYCEKENHKNYEITINNKINIQVMNDSHIQQAYNIFKKNIKEYDLSINFNNITHFKKYFGNIIKNGHIYGPIYSFVVLDENNDVTDWVSIYSSPYKIKGTDELLSVVNLLRLEITKTNVVDLMNNIFYITKHNNFDLFNIPELYNLNNKINNLKLDTCNAMLEYYTYNFNCGIINKNKVSLVLP
jgi:glycylpeptide N-tetradecanoyltransferase